MSLIENVPTISIITACRNAVGTIEDTIRGVIEQDYENIEYIIVDANSDDGTDQVIERYTDKVSLWIREPDEGIADGWNKGIRHASGEIIGIINADDYYTPGAISLVSKAFAENPDCGFLFGDLKVINERTRSWHLEKGHADWERATRFDMFIPHPTVFVRREVYQRIGLFDTRYRIATDYEFVRRMAANGVRGRHLPHVVAVMRQGGVSDSDRIASFREARDISVAYGQRPFLTSAYFWFKYVRTYLGRLIDLLGVDAHQRRKVRSALLGLLRANGRRPG